MSLRKNLIYLLAAASPALLSAQGAKNAKQPVKAAETVPTAAAPAETVKGELPATQQPAVPGLLPRIDVIGTDDAAKSIPGSYTRITSDEIKTQRPISLDEQLKTKTGVHVNDWDGYGLFQRVGIRGQNPNMSQKVLILEDGVPIHPGLFTDPATYYTPPIERYSGMEILKGSGTLRYGPSSIGGTINYVSKEIPKELTTSVTAVGGNNGYLMGLIEGGGTVGKFGAFAQVLRKQGDGNRDYNKFTMHDFMLKTQYQITDDQVIGIKGSYTDLDAQANYTGLSAQMYRENPRQNQMQHDQFVGKRPEANVTYVNQISSKLKWSTVAYYTQFQRDWWRQDVAGGDNPTVNTEGKFNLTTQTQGRNRLFTTMGVDTRMNFDFEAAGFKNRLETGLRYHREKMENKQLRNTSDPTARSGELRTHDDYYGTGLAAYIQDRFFVTDKLAVTPGLRVEHYRMQRDTIVNASAPATVGLSGTSENTAVLPGVGVAWTIVDEFQVFGGWHRGFTPGRVQDAIAVDGASSRLAEERAENYEAGIRGESKGQETGFRYELTGFYTDYQNQIIPASVNSGVANTNAGKSEHLGGELSTGVDFFKKLLSFDVAYTWVPVSRFSADPQTGTSWKSGNRIPYAPEHIASFSIGSRYKGFRAMAQYQFVSSQYADSQNTESESLNGRQGKLPQYGIVNLSASYQILPQLEIFGSVKNLTDEKYIVSRNPIGIYPGMFRQIFIGVTGTL